MSRGRRSPYERFKFKIAEEVKSGKTFSAIKASYPDIPTATLKRWVEGFEAKFRDREETEPKKVSLKLIESRLELSDIDWAKANCKKIFDEEYDNQIRLKSIEVFLKAVGMDKPKDTKEEETEDLSDQYRSMSAEELARLYKDALEG